MRLLVIAFLLFIQINALDPQINGLIDLSESCIIKMENQVPCSYDDNKCNDALDEAEICVRICLQFNKNNEMYNCIKLQCKSNNKNVQQLIEFSLLCLEASKISLSSFVIALLILVIF
ncbi:hypothetical protein ABPG74_019829 [Tetrahymena malaccensis]